MENLFYSHKEKILFWVAGYTDNYSKVDDIVKMLNDKKQEFVDAGADGDICTTFINSSSRYKSMRVFYCKTDNIPDNTFVIGAPKTEKELEGIPEHHRTEWDMWKWLTN